MSTKAEFLSMVLLATFACLTPPHAPAQPLQVQEAQDIQQAQTGSHPQPPPLLDGSRVTHGEVPSTLSEKQKKTIMGANFAKSKKDAAELAALARQLCEELNKPNVNTLSPESMSRLDKIEKLAKKIREEMKGS
jgi:hypothetical protein